MVECLRAGSAQNDGFVEGIAGRAGVRQRERGAESVITLLLELACSGNRHWFDPRPCAALFSSALTRRSCSRSAR